MSFSSKKNDPMYVLHAYKRQVIQRKSFINHIHRLRLYTVLLIEAKKLANGECTLTIVQPNMGIYLRRKASKLVLFFVALIFN